jgi:SnoaL-like domain
MQYTRLGSTDQAVAEAIVAQETQALVRWGAGDPSGFLDICHPDVTYFDPFLEERLDGLSALTSTYERIRGKIHIDSFELVNPRVVVGGEMAVLSFNFVSKDGNDTLRWNCTEVYRSAAPRWLIVQTHWSFVQPAGATA